MNTVNICKVFDNIFFRDCMFNFIILVVFINIYFNRNKKKTLITIKMNLLFNLFNTKLTKWWQCLCQKIKCKLSKGGWHSPYVPLYYIKVPTRVKL